MSKVKLPPRSRRDFALSLSGLLAAHCLTRLRSQDLHDGLYPREVMVNELVGKYWAHFVHVFMICNLLISE